MGSQSRESGRESESGVGVRSWNQESESGVGVHYLDDSLTCARLYIAASQSQHKGSK